MTLFGQGSTNLDSWAFFHNHLEWNEHLQKDAIDSLKKLWWNVSPKKGPAPNLVGN